MWDSLEQCKDTSAPGRGGKVLIHQHAKDYHLLLARDVDGAVVAILALLIGRMPPMVQKSFLADLMQDTTP